MKTATNIFLFILVMIIGNPVFSQQKPDKDLEQMVFLLEEEKLAKDLYTHFYDLYQLRVFGNIRLSEEQHMNMVKSLLMNAGSDFTTFEEKGKFHNKELQELYNNLIHEGEKSQLEALKIGKLIEETDIRDLKKAREETNSETTKIVYSNLIRASENHLNAFKRWIGKIK